MCCVVVGCPVVVVIVVVATPVVGISVVVCCVVVGCSVVVWVVVLSVFTLETFLLLQTLGAQFDVAYDILSVGFKTPELSFEYNIKFCLS